MSQVPWSRIREFKEEQERKKKKELEAALRQQQQQFGGGGVGGGGFGGLQQQQQQGGGADAQSHGQQEEKSFQERFKQPYFKERLLFGGIVGAVTGSFFGGLDAVQGIKKGEAFGVRLNTLPAKAKFSAEHVGSAALVFSIFYASYQGVKYISKVARDDEDDWGNPVTATFVTVLPLMASTTFRRNVPYALLLIGMDVVSDASSQNPIKS